LTHCWTPIMHAAARGHDEILGSPLLCTAAQFTPLSAVCLPQSSLMRRCSPECCTRSDRLEGLEGPHCDGHRSRERSPRG
jgi:hypothetical protein